MARRGTEAAGVVAAGSEVEVDDEVVGTDDVVEVEVEVDEELVVLDEVVCEEVVCEEVEVAGPVFTTLGGN